MIMCDFNSPTDSGHQLTPRHRVLLVDDEQSILFTLGECLRRLGYEVDCADTLTSALSCLRSGRSHALVIADLRLSPPNGQEGLAILEEARRCNPGVRTIMLTAYGSPTTEREARARGVDAYLVKPKRLREISDVIAALLDGSSS